MCSVAAIPFVLMGAQGLAGAQQSKAAGEASVAANEANAGLATRNANEALKTGAFESDRQRLQTAAAIGTQRTGFAANGVDVNSGSAANVQDDTAALGELDALTISNNAAKEAWGYRKQAEQSLIAAKNAKKTAQSSMFGSLLSAGAQGARAYTSFKG